MSTFLAAGAVLMVRVLTASIVAFLILAAVSGAAFAQDAVAVTPTGPAAVPDATWAETIDLWINGVVAAVGTLFLSVAAWASPHVPSWARGWFDKVTTTEAGGWQEYIETALHDALTIGAARAGVTPENLSTMEQKADLLGWAVGALRKYNKDIVSWLDKDGNGVVDFVEDGLLKLGAPAKLFEAAPAPFPVPPAPQAAMGFMDAAQPRRAVKAKSPQAMAAELSPFTRRKKGEVTQ